MEYVYKYVDCNEVVQYVGITNNMLRRTQQHKHDKLKNIKSPAIYYFPVQYRADAEMIETYLINYYNTGNAFNVSKTKKGDVSFLDNVCEDLPWRLFSGTVNNNIKPFIASTIITKEQVVEKKVYMSGRSASEIIDKHYTDLIRISQENKELIEYEDKVIAWLKANNCNPVIDHGLYLHKKRRLCAQLISRRLADYFSPFGNERQKENVNKLLDILGNTKREIDRYEESLQIASQSNTNENNKELSTTPKAKNRAMQFIVRTLNESGHEITVNALDQLCELANISKSTRQRAKNELIKNEVVAIRQQGFGDSKKWYASLQKEDK